MFERFTDQAREVVVLAQDESRELKHNYIGTEHLLLGLLREEEGLAARVLESLDISVEDVRAQVARIVGQGDEVTTGQIPFTPRAKKVLELSLREALALGRKSIGTEHVLLGLLREGEGVLQIGSWSTSEPSPRSFAPRSCGSLVRTPAPTGRKRPSAQGRVVSPLPSAPSSRSLVPQPAWPPAG